MAFIGVAVLIFIFLGLPNLVTYQPAFCGSCHPEVYKQWSTSTHAKIGCMQCHVKSGFNNLLLSRVGLLQRIYLRFNAAEFKRMKQKNEKPIGFVASPSNEICLPCHEARKRISPSGDIIIPHQSHIKIRKLACTDCHASFVCARVGKDKAIVTMEGCYRCHSATNECTTCHNTEKGAPGYDLKDLRRYPGRRGWQIQRRHPVQDRRRDAQVITFYEAQLEKYDWKLEEVVVTKDGQILRLSKGTRKTSIDLASAYLRLGRKDDAIAQIKQALAINPGRTQAKTWLKTLESNNTN